MKTSLKRKLIVLLGVAAVLLVPLTAQAVTYGFYNITNNNAANAATAGQYLVDVTAYAATPANDVLFLFTNSGPVASSICDVYFDDGTLLYLAQVFNSTGVSFTQAEISKVSPPDLPGGNNITPHFNVTGYFKADTDPPVQPNGVNPGEQLGILFTLQPGEDVAHTVTALTNGDLRIGIHVQAIGTGGSESFVNNKIPGGGGGVIPVPPTVWLLGSGLVGIGLLGWRRKKS